MCIDVDLNILNIWIFIMKTVHVDLTLQKFYKTIYTTWCILVKYTRYLIQFDGIVLLAQLFVFTVRVCVHICMPVTNIHNVIGLHQVFHIYTTVCVVHVFCCNSV